MHNQLHSEKKVIYLTSFLHFHADATLGPAVCVAEALHHFFVAVRGRLFLDTVLTHVLLALRLERRIKVSDQVRCCEPESEVIFSSVGVVERKHVTDFQGGGGWGIDISLSSEMSEILGKIAPPPCLTLPPPKITKAARRYAFFSEPKIPVGEWGCPIRDRDLPSLEPVVNIARFNVILQS